MVTRGWKSREIFDFFLEPVGPWDRFPDGVIGLPSLRREGSKVVADLVANLAEESQALWLGPVVVGGIDEAVVDGHGSSGKNGAEFAGIVTYGKHVIETLAGEIVDVFGAVAAQVDANFLHDGNRFRTDFRRVHARAEDLKAIAGIVPEQALGHLAASGVAGAQDQDALLLHVFAFAMLG